MDLKIILLSIFAPMCLCDFPTFTVTRGVVEATGFPIASTNLYFVVCDNALQFRALFNSDCLPKYDIKENFTLFVDAGVLAVQSEIEQDDIYELDLQQFEDFQPEVQNVIYYHFSSDEENQVDFKGPYHPQAFSSTHAPTSTPDETPTEPHPTEPPTEAPCMCDFTFEVGDVVSFIGEPRDGLSQSSVGAVKCGSTEYNGWLIVQWENYDLGDWDGSQFCNCGDDLEAVDDTSLAFVECSEVEESAPVETQPAQSTVEPATDPGVETDSPVNTDEPETEPGVQTESPDNTNLPTDPPDDSTDKPIDSTDEPIDSTDEPEADSDNSYAHSKQQGSIFCFLILFVTLLHVIDV